MERTAAAVNGVVKRSIAVVATLDTKGLEANYLREQINQLGHQTVMIDVGVVGTPAIRADITREEVAFAGGVSLTELLAEPSRETAAPVMAEGATKVLQDLVQKDRIHGVVAIGGTQGTTLATRAMRSLPYGLPKMMVSTMASGDVSHWVDIKDITMMFSVTDILGLNSVLRMVLANAARAICGMAQGKSRVEQDGKFLVAVTTVGITMPGATKAIEVLHASGFETIVFHAIGAGGRAMEQLMREGVIGAVLDFATIEVSNQLYSALLAADDARLTTAGRLGLPQVICPGAVEVLVFQEPETVPAPFNKRPLVRHTPQITDVRLNAVEMKHVAEELSRRLSHTSQDAIFMVPTRGFDCYGIEGEAFHDPTADAAFTQVLRERLPQNVRLLERDTDINDPAFATEAAQRLVGLIRAQSKG